MERSHSPPTCTVTEEAVSVVLFQGKKELREVPLEFHPDEPWTLRP